MGTNTPPALEAIPRPASTLGRRDWSMLFFGASSVLVLEAERTFCAASELVRLLDRLAASALGRFLRSTLVRFCSELFLPNMIGFDLVNLRLPTSLTSSSSLSPSSSSLGCGRARLIGRGRAGTLAPLAPGIGLGWLNWSRLFRPSDAIEYPLLSIPGSFSSSTSSMFLFSAFASGRLSRRDAQRTSLTTPRNSSFHDESVARGTG